MKDMTLIVCPIKQTKTYRWVCSERCKYTREQCSTALLELRKETKHCIDCKYYGKIQPCKVCMNADPDLRKGRSGNSCKNLCQKVARTS